MEDVVGAEDRWIPEAEYDLIRARVPIVCVDLIPLSEGPEPKIGLIHRKTFADLEGWCLVGGAVLRNESLTAAVKRHLRSTLGPSMDLDASTLQLLGVIEYFTEPGLGPFYDPRKHAVSLTYYAPCDGSPRPQGEALKFQWFDRTELATLEFGFGQGAVIDRFLRLRDARQ